MKKTLGFIGVGLVLLLSAFSAGGQGKSVELKIGVKDLKERNLSDIAEKVEYIQLETTEQSLIGKMKNVLINNHSIYIIRPEREVLQFSKNGKFLRKIGSIGKGPHEYIYASCATDGENLYLLSPEARILKYDRNGKFVEEVNLRKKWKLGENRGLSSFSVMNFTCWKNHFLFMGAQLFVPDSDGGFNNYTKLLVTDMNYHVQDSFLLRDYHIPAMAIHIAGSTEFFCNHGNELSIFPFSISKATAQDDTLFLYQERKIIPGAVCHFENAERDEEGVPAIVLRNMAEVGPYCFIWYRHGTKGNNLYAYNRKSGNTFHTNALKDDFHHTGDVILNNTQDGQLYFKKEGYELEGIFDGVNEDSNPFIFIVTLKQ